MEYNITINPNISNSYLDRLVNKIFAILGIFEDCSDKKDYNDYFIYLDRLSTELHGCQYTLEYTDFISLYNIIVGMAQSDVMEHKKVKSLVFHCISLIKKMKVIDSGLL